MKGVILVTGFGPFAGVDVNPTEALATSLDGTRFGAFGVHAAVLDVSYARAGAELRALVALTRPVAMVHFGVARGERVLRVEKRAVNRMHAADADVDGARHEGARVVDSLALDAWLETRVDAEGLALRLVEAGHPARTSEDAGRYVCNALYFGALALAAEAAIPCVFVHVPNESAPPEGASPEASAWTRARLDAAARVVLEAVAESAGAERAPRVDVG